METSGLNSSTQVSSKECTGLQTFFSSERFNNCELDSDSGEEEIHKSDTMCTITNDILKDPTERLNTDKSYCNPRPEEIHKYDSTCSTIGNTSKKKCHKRKLPCEICEEKECIYTCPGCELQTCSLACVKEHKTRLGCNGERNKTAFVDKDVYGESHMLNDYRFLEDTNRKLFSLAGSHYQEKNGYQHSLHRRVKFLKTAAYKRGVKLMMISPELSKHKRNSSFYIIRNDLISWHIDWHFVSTSTVVADKRVPEDTTLLDAAMKWTNFVDHPELVKLLKEYEKKNLEKSKFLLKIDCLPANRTRYYELNPSLSIAKNLQGHCITEYPNIYIVPPLYAKTSDFVLLSAEDLSFMAAPNHKHLKQLVDTTSPEEIEAQLLNPKSQLYVPNSNEPSLISN